MEGRELLVGGRMAPGSGLKATSPVPGNARPIFVGRVTMADAARATEGGGGGGWRKVNSVALGNANGATFRDLLESGLDRLGDGVFAMLPLDKGALLRLAGVLSTTGGVSMASDLLSSSASSPNKSKVSESRF